MAPANVSVVIPVFNEPLDLQQLVSDIALKTPGAEILVIDDGSEQPVAELKGARIIRHPRNLGNGAAIKTGARSARGDIIVFMDGDGQHDPADIPRLLEKTDAGFDLVVGARHYSSHASKPRLWANAFFNTLASAITGFRILDLTSGFRAVRAKKFRNFLYLLPNGFSYPTTSTIAFFRCGYSVDYVPIKAAQRQGDSKISIIRDGIRFFLIILKIGALFSPMRFFLPISFALALLASGHYLYTYVTSQRFTNMSALLYSTAILTFLLGIVSEQISSLHYRNSEERRRGSDP